MWVEIFAVESAVPPSDPVVPSLIDWLLLCWLWDGWLLVWKVQRLTERGHESDRMAMFFFLGRRIGPTDGDIPHHCHLFEVSLVLK